MLERERALARVLEVVQRCRHCHREMNVSASAYAESPFCDVCRAERVAALTPSDIEWEQTGDYLALKPR